MAKNKEQDLPLAQPGDLRALLLQYRDLAGYTTEQMASALCLSESVINNLENEEFHLLAEPPYVRGYLRNYTKLVDADDAEVIHCYETLRGADPSELDYHIKATPSMHQSKNKLSPILTQLFLLLFLIAAIAGIFMIPAVNQWITSTWDSFSQQTGADNKPSLLGTMPVPLPLNNKSIPIPDKGALSNKNIQTPITADKKQPKEVLKNKAITEKELLNQADKTNLNNANNIPQGNKPTTDDEAASTGSNNTISIKMIFTKEVWMRIRDKNKKTVYEGQTVAGKEKSLSLEKPLTFRVGNAQGLSLFVNDKAVDISQYIKGSVANFTLK